MSTDEQLWYQQYQHDDINEETMIAKRTSVKMATMVATKVHAMSVTIVDTMAITLGTTRISIAMLMELASR
jgi:hypothetical protein